MRGVDLIVGYYGFRNFGDDLFRQVLSNAMAEAPQLNVAISQARRETLDKVSRNVRAAINIARARSITLGGGSILGARPPFGIRHVERIASRMKRIPYCAVGVGVLEGLSRAPLSMVESMSWVGLRSEREYAIFAREFSHVHYMSDIAYAAPRFVQRLTPETSAGVVVIPASVGELGQSAIDDSYVDSWIRSISVNFDASTPLTVLLLQPANARDSALCDRFMERGSAIFSSVKVLHHKDVRETQGVIASSDFVFTDRLHGAIVAHVFGVPFLLSKHHDKCLDFLRDIHHPDVDQDDSLAANADSGRLDRIRDWSTNQSQVVLRHSELAEAGIESWLAHLTERSN